MKGISYVVNEDKEPIAVQIDLEEYGDLWEDFYDRMTARNRKNEESIPLEDFIEQMKSDGIIDQDV